MYMCLCVLIHTCVCVCACVCVHVCVCVRACVRACACVAACLSLSLFRSHSRSPPVCVLCVCVCVYAVVACAYVCVSVYKHLPNLLHILKGTFPANIDLFFPQLLRIHIHVCNIDIDICPAYYNTGI